MTLTNDLALPLNVRITAMIINAYQALSPSRLAGEFGLFGVPRYAIVGLAPFLSQLAKRTTYYSWSKPILDIRL